MNQLIEKYDIQTAASWIRGYAKHAAVPGITDKLLSKEIEELSEEELCAIVGAGQQAGLKLYPFKKGTKELPRVRRTIGFLYSIQFETMLDVGSGRGVFLIPFMKKFPWVQVTSLDLLDKRVTFLNELASGGFKQMHAEQKNIWDQPYLDKSFDVITLLEVLEHIHLLTKEKLTKMFAEAGCTKLHFDGVEGHLFMVAAIE